MDSFSTLLPVVAVALIDHRERVLMQRRSLDGAHGGLWEFPGGKVEVGETPVEALLREVEEELGLVLDGKALTPLTFSADIVNSPARRPIVILLYLCRTWTGEPRCCGAEEIRWFPLTDLYGLEMPPLDYPLADALLTACRSRL